MFEQDFHSPFNPYMYKKENHQNTVFYTSVLFIILILLSSSLIISAYWPEIEHYRLTHQEYEIYGGMNSELRDSEFFEDISSGKSLCFLGDSITYGTATDGIHWYQPLLPYIKGEVSELSYGGWTIMDLLNISNEIPKADIYVIAIGINDVLFPDSDWSAKTDTVFVDRCNQLAEKISDLSPNAKIYFIAPWSFTGFDESLVIRGDQFRAALEEFCKTNNYSYIDPDPVITYVLEHYDKQEFMYNCYHPNAQEGVGLYSYAVLVESHNLRTTPGK